MNKGIFAIFFVVAVLSISFPVNAQETSQRVGEDIHQKVYIMKYMLQKIWRKTTLSFAEQVLV